MAATPSLIGLGTSALNAYRASLSVTGNNISNVGVEGYSRQRTDLSLADSMQTPGGYMGNGVETADIARSYDQFLTRNLGTAISSGSHYEIYHKYASSIDEMVADPEAGMTPALTSFFNALQDLSNNPSSIPARQVVHGEGEALVNRFNTIYREMEKIRDQSQLEVESTVEKINAIASSIAEMNLRIAESVTSPSGKPNELLDRRDMLLKELSGYIGVNTLEQDGMVSVLIGKGQSLVNGTDASELSLEGSQNVGGGDVELYIKQGKHNTNITAAIKGGSIGGIVDFTREILNPAENALGRIAISLSATLNAQHQAGYGLGGASDTGNYFFDLGAMTQDVDGRPVMELTEAVTSDNSEADLTVTIPMSSGVLDTGEIIASVVTNNPITGLTINGTLIGDVNAGEATTLTTAEEETVDNLIEQINLKTSYTGVTAEVGENGTVRLLSDEDIAITVAAGGDISATGWEEKNYRMVKTAVKNLSMDDYSLTYNGNNYVITNLTTRAERVLSTAEERELIHRESADMGVVHNGLTFSLNDPMEEGDRIEVKAMRGGAQDIGMALKSSELGSIAASDVADEAGNNNNVLNMIALQTDKLMAANTSGDATTGLQESYGQLVADIGVRAHHADVNRIAQQSIRNNAQNARDNNAAVNLDEEAANLMKFQQMYQASTKVISMADKLFQSVLNAV